MAGERLDATVLLAAALELHRHGRLDEAIEAYAGAVRHDPRLAEAYNNLGVALRAQGKVEAAIACYRRAVALRPGHAPALSNLGNALRGRGRLEAAVAALAAALEADPASSEITCNLALALRDHGRLDEAIDLFDRALALRPGRAALHVDRGIARLLAGDLAGGFADLAWRRPAPPAGGPPAWDGRPIDGRSVLLRVERTDADALQFLRYVPLVAAAGTGVVLEVPADLAPLARTVEGVSRVIGPGERPPAVAAAASVADLPRLFATTRDTVPAAGPYLAVPEGAVPVVPEAGARPAVGLVWSAIPGGGGAARDPSCPVGTLLALAAPAGAALYGLPADPRGVADEALRAAGGEALVVDLGPRIESLAGLAATLDRLDLVIAVDGTTAHLAGALGRPVWLLLPYAPDGRWMLGRDDTPWYPGMRLFRQRHPGDWEEVIARVGAALERRYPVRPKRRDDGSERT